MSADEDLKCDDNRPCKACVNLGIPCTENRQSKRRGPPNRTLQRIKAQQAGDVPFEGAGSSSPDNAAQALTTLANQTADGVKVLGELQIVTALLDDYLTYIHPIAPVPHEPTFRAALSARADIHDPNFVALVAAMVGALTAACPQRARMQFSRVHDFSASSYAAYCRSIVLRVLPPEYLERGPFSTNDVMINYLLGFASMHEGYLPATHLYFNQCQSIISSGHLTPPSDSIDFEIRRRVMWALFSSVKDLEQAGVASQALSASINALIQTAEMPLPSDDEYLTGSGPSPVSRVSISRHMVFDSTIRLYNAITHLPDLDHLLTKGIVPWSIVQMQYQQAMTDVDSLLLQVPPAMSLSSQSVKGSANNEKGIQHSGNHQYPPGQYPLPREGDDFRDRAIHEALLQETSSNPKAILCANVLQVKSYLIEKYICSLQSHAAQSEPPFNFKASSEKSKSKEQIAHEATFDSAVREKDTVVRHVLNALMDVTQRDDTASLNHDFVDKMAGTIDRLLHTPSPIPDGDPSSSNGLVHSKPTTPRGPLVQRAALYLEAVASILQSLGHYLAVRGDRYGVEKDVQQCWADVKVLGNEFGIGQMVEG